MGFADDPSSEISQSGLEYAAHFAVFDRKPGEYSIPFFVILTCPTGSTTAPVIRLQSPASTLLVRRLNGVCRYRRAARLGHIG